MKMTLLSQNEWFREQHYWYTNKSYQKKHNWQLLIRFKRANKWRPIYKSSFQRNIDHSIDDWRSERFLISIICQPLNDDQKIHISKEDCKKNDLRNELKEEVCFWLKGKWIDSFHTNSKTHLSYTKNYAHFHFQRVDKRDFIFGSIPPVVNSPRVDTSFCLSVRLIWVARSTKEFDRERSKIIIKSSDKEGKETHESNEVFRRSNSWERSSLKFMREED